MRKIFCLLIIAFLSVSAITVNRNSEKSIAPFSVLTDVIQSSGTINLSIPDEDATGIFNTLSVSGIPPGATIDSVIASFTIPHTALADIMVNLEAPNGKIINLVANHDNSDPQGYQNTRITSDLNPPPHTTVPAVSSGPITGTYLADAFTQATLNGFYFIVATPAVTTSTFSDLFSTPNGNWTIHVYDGLSGDVGTLVSWSIKISYTPPVVTPVSLLSFSGYREGNHNLLKWSTASEQNNKGFQIERSTDGINYSPIGFVNSRSVNGNSASLLHYTFNDNNLSGSKQYYRLKQSDIDGREKLSNIILIKDQLPTSLNLSGLFPNPADNIISIIVDAPDGNEVELMITDMNGKFIKKQSAAVEAGTNTIPVDISKLTNGIYAVKLSCKSTCDTVTGKFIKQ